MTKDLEYPSTALPVIEDRWATLRQFTDARIGLGRAGVSVPTQHLLAFQLAHAKAQDAVHQPLDVSQLVNRLIARSDFPQAEPICLHSAAPDRSVYLQRPDLGRQLDSDSARLLQDCRNAHSEEWDLAIVIVDGLSAFAIEENAFPFLDCLMPGLSSATDPWRVAPVCVVQQGRVAIGDVIGELLRVRCALALIGERPGLSSPDSMGLYLTWNPTVGKTDAHRNCISNIRPAGLKYKEASRRALYLLSEARVKKLSGIQLKDRTDGVVIGGSGQAPGE